MISRLNYINYLRLFRSITLPLRCLRGEGINALLVFLFLYQKPAKTILLCHSFLHKKNLENKCEIKEDRSGKLIDTL